MGEERESGWRMEMRDSPERKGETDFARDAQAALLVLTPFSSRSTALVRSCRMRCICSNSTESTRGRLATTIFPTFRLMRGSDGVVKEGERT